MKLDNRQRLKRAYAALEWRRKYDATTWQRMMVLTFVCLLVLIAVPFNLLGLSGPANPLFNVLNLGQYAFVIAALAALRLRLIKLDTALVLTLTMVQCFMVGEMLQCALTPTPSNIILIFGDLFLSLGVIVLALTANFRILPFVLSALTASAYISCIAMTGDEMLVNFSPLTFQSFLLIPILGYMFVRNFRRLETENIRMKDTERNVLDALGIDKERAMEFVHSSRKGRIRMLDFFNESARRKLQDEIEEINDKAKASLQQIKDAIPELTPSEAEIALLIVQGHKTAEICMRLGKEKGNITSQRTHIRTKLRLTDSRADLRTALAERLSLRQ